MPPPPLKDQILVHPLVIGILLNQGCQFQPTDGRYHQKQVSIAQIWSKLIETYFPK